MKKTSALLLCLSMASFASAQAADAPQDAGFMSVATTEDSLAVESKDGAVTYRAVVDRKTGGNIKQLCLPAGGPSVVSDLDDLFFHGSHDDEYTLRGWTGRSRCILSCSTEVLSKKPGEIVVGVNAVAAGTFKIVSTSEAVKAKLKGKLRSYQEKTVEIHRVYAFKPDRVVTSDEVLWVHPDFDFNSIEWTASFVPGCVQSPARLIKGEVKASFYPVGSGGDKLPKGIAYPFTAENFLKSGWKVSLLTREASFDLRKSNLYFYEKPWQQDWNQVSGYKYNLAGQPKGKPVKLTHEFVFSKAAPSEMPPVITLRSPGPEARWMDEKGEVAKFKVGETVKLVASAVNSDGSPVPDKDISWEIRIEPWWKRPPVIIQGAQSSYKLPGAANDEEKSAAQKRLLMAVIKVTAKGANGTEATEHFAMLVGNPGPS